MNTSPIDPSSSAEPAGTASHRVIALYKFVALSDLETLQADLLDTCLANGILGTILLAQEGINGTVSGSHTGIDALLVWLRAKPWFHDSEVKESWADAPPFYRMKVRLKREIVTLGVPEVDPTQQVGTYVDPKDWNALIDREDVVVVDTRNDYEVAIGTFKNALDPQTKSFRELPDWVDENLKDNPAIGPNTKIAMFCTGGIRCEKSTALLKSRGFDDVYHLKGGILKYLEEVRPQESRWEGECFVFDQRVSVKHGLEPGNYDMCHACRMPINADEMNSPLYERGVSCPHCHDGQDEQQRARYAERQKQIDLAKMRNENHIAADVSQAKAEKRKIKEEQRARSQSK